MPRLRHDQTTPANTEAAAAAAAADNPARAQPTARDDGQLDLQFLPERSSKWFKVESSLALPLFLPDILRVQFIVCVNFHDPKAEGLLNSNEVTVTSGFNGNFQISQETLQHKYTNFEVKRLGCTYCNNYSQTFRKTFTNSTKPIVPYEFVTHCDMIC
ncbi:hypothetical protein TSAR_007248 [Trichomalopsis sarcophagae]|uniref:Uncharacterized protein n=1 Tax=Trichomalopsis sarcophagae TaxID=543379 RepID=A0A232EW77_9HYME|nr:hypothetical protein TSAR_007248 [Trichomalopsis sarcophagae]